MPRVLLVLVIANVLILFVACTEEAAVPEGEGSGLFCEGENISCEGNKLTICGIDGKKAYTDCEDICAEQDLVYTGVCQFNEDRGHDFCECEEACCEAGRQRCTDDNTLEVCVNCGWNTVKCDEYCARFGAQVIGCAIDEETESPACLCEEDPSLVCGPGFTKCKEGIVNICAEGGQWSAASCRNACQREGYHFSTCDLDAETPEESCRCTESEESELCKSVAPTCQGEKLAVCVNDEIELIDCEQYCDDIGFVFVACQNDRDRDHDACFCERAEEQSGE